VEGLLLAQFSELRLLLPVDSGLIHRADAVAAMLSQQKDRLAISKYRRIAAVAERAAGRAVAALQNAGSTQQALE